MTDETSAGPREIPISAANRIAKDYGYDQVLIYARRHTGPVTLEHMTTYGVTKEDCRVAGLMAQTLQKFMGWKTDV